MICQPEYIATPAVAAIAVTAVAAVLAIVVVIVMQNIDVQLVHANKHYLSKLDKTITTRFILIRGTRNHIK